MFTEEIGQNLISKDKDKREQASLLLLAAFRERVENMGDSNYFNDLRSQLTGDKVKTNNPFCSICLLSIKNGDYSFCMNCCNSFCHISCLAKIAEMRNDLLPHKCPHCEKQLTFEVEDKALRMHQVIESVMKSFQY